MRLRAIDIAVKKHHEVRRYLVDVGRVFRHDRNLVADVDRNGRQKLVIAPFFRYLVPNFVVQVIQPVRLPRIACAVDDNHRHLVLRLVVRVLHRLENTRTLPEYAWHIKERLLPFVVRTLYLYVEKTLEQLVGYSEFGIEAYEFHLYNLLVMSALVLSVSGIPRFSTWQEYGRIAICRCFLSTSVSSSDWHLTGA